MSKEIEDRVLKMELDNSNFESNAKQSMSTLDKLKEKLKMKDSSQGMEDLGKVAKDTNLKPLADSVEAVKVKFSALQIAGVAALTKITNSAIDTGEKLVKGLTIDQVSAGWDKYAEKTSAVQTIMAATAKDFDNQEVQMAAVNAQLNKLMWYADETSYSFNDMVSNIGKFTSNNIPLDKSVTAMEGISSWAAISGANVNEASRAMYNLSQAISVGAVKLMDWKSIELANMATAEFKQTAIDTAVSLGTLKEVSDGVYKTMNGNTVSVENFSASLSDAWFTSDVLMKSLGKYGKFSDLLYEASEKTGLTATELLTSISKYKEGNLDLDTMARETGMSASELKDTLSGLSDATMDLGSRSFRAAQEAKTFKEAIDATRDAVSSGWSQTFELIFGNYLESKELWTDMANGLYDIFAAWGEVRNEELAIWKDLGGRDELFEGVYTLASKFSELVAPIKEAWSDIFEPISGEKLYALTKGFNDFVQNLTVSESTLTNLHDTFEGLFSIIRLVGTGIKTTFQIFGIVIGPLASLFFNITGSIGKCLTAVDQWVSGVQKAKTGASDAAKEFIGIGALLNALSNGISKAASFIVDALKNVITFLKEAATGVNLFDAAIVAFTALATGKFIGFLKSLKSSLPKLSDITGVFESISGAFDSFSKSTNASSVLKLAGGLLALALALKIVSTIETDALFGGFLALGGVLAELFALMEAVSILPNTKKIAAVSVSLVPLSIALLAIAGALKILSAISFSGIGVGLLGLGGSLAIIAGALQIMPNPAKMAVSSVSLLAVAAALLVLSVSLKVLSTMSLEEVGTALLGLGGSLAIFAIGLRFMSGTAKGSASLLLAAMAIAALAPAIKILSTIPLESVGTALLALAGSLIIMGVASAVLDKVAPTMAKTAAAILIFSVAIIGLGIGLNILARLSVAEIGRSFLALAGALTILGVASAAMGSIAPKMALLGGCLIILAMGLAAIFVPIAAIGAMPLANIAKGIGALIGVFITIGAASKLLTNSAGAIVKLSAAMIVFGAGASAIAIAITFLSIAIKNLADIPIDHAIGSVVALTAFLGALIGAMKLLNHVKAPSIKAVATIGILTIVLIGISYALSLIGNLQISGTLVNVTMLSSVFTALAGACRLMSGIPVAAAAKAALALSAFIGVLTTAMAALGGLDALFGNLLSKGVFQFGKIIGSFVDGFVSSATQSLPQVADDLVAFGEKLGPFMTVLKEIEPASVDSLRSLVGVLGDITKINIGNKFASFIGGDTDFTKFADGLAALGKGIDDFSQSIGTNEAFNTESFNAALDFLEKMVEIQGNLEGIGGLKDIVYGKDDFGTFAENLSSLATGLKAFATNLTGDEGLTDEAISAIQKIPELVQPLIELQKTLGGNTVGGLVGAIVGHNENLGDFGQTLADLGEGLGQFYTAIQTAFGGENASGQIGNVEIPIETFQNAAEAIAYFIDLNKLLQAENGKELDTNALTDFATALPRALQNIKFSFNDLSELEVDESTVTKAGQIAQVIQKFVDIQKQLSASAQGLAESEADPVTLAGFGAQISSLVTAVDDFVTNLGEDNINVSKLESAGNVLKNAIKKIKEAFDEFADFDTSGMQTFADAINDVVSGSLYDAISDFNTHAGDLKIAITDFFVAIDDSISTNAEALTTKFDGIFDGLSSSAENAKPDFKQVGIDICSSFKTGLSEGTQNLGQSFTNSLENILTQAKAYADNFDQVGKEILTAVADGLHDTTTISSALTTCLRTAAATCSKDASSIFYNVGTKISDGVADGIKSKYSVVTAAAQRLITICQEAAAAAAQINSPSKLFANTIGRFIPEGVAKGMDKNVKYVKKSAVSMALATLDATQNALGIHSPSIVFNEEVGRYIADGVAEGIESTKTPEEAAKKKAENVVAAFKEAIDRLDLKTKIRNMESELFGLENPTKSYQNIIAEQAEARAFEIKNQEQIVRYYEDQLFDMANYVDKESEEYQNSYYDWLEARKKLYELQLSDADAAYEAIANMGKTESDIDSKLLTLYQTVGKSDDDLYTAIEREIHNKERLIEIQAENTRAILVKLDEYGKVYGKGSIQYKELFGQVIDDVNTYATMINDLKEAFGTVGANQKQAYVTTLEEINDGTDWAETFIQIMQNQGHTIEEAKNTLWDIVGSRNGYAPTDSLALTISKANQEITSALDETMESIRGFLNSGNISDLEKIFNEFGTSVGESLTAGFQFAEGTVNETVFSMTETVTDTANAASEQWEDTGVSWAKSLADGIRDGIGEVAKAVKEVIDRAFNTASSSAKSKVSSYSSNVLSVGSVPSNIGDLLSTTTKSTSSKLMTSSGELKKKDQNANSTTNNVVNYNQTINSPKTLSASEIARHSSITGKKIEHALIYAP